MFVVFVLTGLCTSIESVSIFEDAAVLEVFPFIMRASFTTFPNASSLKKVYSPTYLYTIH